MALNFPQRHQSRFLFRSFSASFVCIVEDLASLSVFSLSLTDRSDSYGFSLSKNYQVSQKNSKKSHLMTNWNRLLGVAEWY